MKSRLNDGQVKVIRSKSRPDQVRVKVMSNSDQVQVKVRSISVLRSSQSQIKIRSKSGQNLVNFKVRSR